MAKHKLTREEEQEAIRAFMAAREDADDEGDEEAEDAPPARKAAARKPKATGAKLPPTFSADGATVYPGPSGTIVVRQGRMTAALYPQQWAAIFGHPAEDADALADAARALGEVSGIPSGVAGFLAVAADLGEERWLAACRRRAVESGRYAEDGSGTLVPVKGKAPGRTGPRW